MRSQLHLYHGQLFEEEDLSLSRLGGRVYEDVQSIFCRRATKAPDGLVRSSEFRSRPSLVGATPSSSGDQFRGVFPAELRSSLPKIHIF